MGEIEWAPETVAGPAESADLVAKRAAVELLAAAEATVWADSFSRSANQVDALAVSALTFAFAVTAARWRVEETGPSGHHGVTPSTTEQMNAIVNRLTWLGDIEDPPLVEEATAVRGLPGAHSGSSTVPSTHWVRRFGLGPRRPGK